MPSINLRKRLGRAIWHLRNGTFFYAVKKKLGRARGGKRKAKGNQYYGDIAEGYLERRVKQAWWHTEQSTMRALLQTIPENASVLDVPFGTGRFVPYYHERNIHVTGIDISEAMLTAAEKALGVAFSRCTVQVGDATCLPFADGSFDYVCSFRFLDTIVSFFDAKRAIAEFSRVAREGAILEMCERKAAAPPCGLPSDDDVMGGLLDEAAIGALLLRAGFTVERKFGPVKDSGDWLMYVYLLKKR